MTAVPLILKMPHHSMGHTDSDLSLPEPESVIEPDVPTAGMMAGFHEVYRRIGISAERLCQTSAEAYALTELLVSKGIIGIDELGDRRGPVLERMREATGSAGVTVELAPGPDKYTAGGTVQIDCADRLQLCHAACCRLRFALSPQDVEEGIVQWEIPAPYLNRQRPDDYCVHCDSDTGHCGVYQNRPSVCREYDCRSDDRIWTDFDRRIPNPELVGPL